MKKFICSLFVAVFVFSSCTVLDRSSDIYYNENKLSLDDITNMRHEFSEVEPSVKGINLIPYENAVSDEPVYWVDGGQVWHLKTECGYISDGSTVFYGSLENAVQCGKYRVCSSCENNKQKNIN